MRKGWVLLCLAASLCVVACDQPKEPAPKSSDGPPVKAAQNDTGGTVSKEGPKTPDAADKATIEKLEKEYTTAKADFEKSKDDKGKKGAYLKATMAAGDAYMYTQDVDTKVKYKKALTFYREAYKVDPETPNAKQNIDLIEGIYKSMNRPIPE